MDDELKLLSTHINKHHWVKARKLAAQLATNETLQSNAHFWFQVALLAHLINNKELHEAAKLRMEERCPNYEAIITVDLLRNEGLHYLRLGQVKLATAAFAESFKLLSKVQPDDFNRAAMNQACLGMVKMAQDDVPAAVEAFRRAFGTWTGTGLFWSPPALRFQRIRKHQPGQSPNDAAQQMSKRIVILEDLQPGSNLQWVINSAFHFLQVLVVADNPLLQGYVRACYDFVVSEDPSFTRRLWARLLYLHGAPAVVLCERLRKLRYRL